MSDWYGFESDEDDEDVSDKAQGTLIPKHQGAINGTAGQRPAAPPPQPPPVVEEIKELFFNKYRHCGIEWDDTNTTECSDVCPCCGEDVNPYESEALL